MLLINVLLIYVICRTLLNVRKRVIFRRGYIIQWLVAMGGGGVMLLAIIDFHLSTYLHLE